MPDIPDRDSTESELAKFLGKWFKEQQKLIIQLLGDPPDINNIPPEFWNEIGAEAEAVLRPFLSKQSLLAAERLLETVSIGIDWALINQAAADWARQYTYDLVRGINDTSRQTLQRIIPRYFEQAMTQGELRETLGNLYSPVRAEMIARTEVTRAAVEGERMTVAEIEKYGYRMKPIWQTRNDEIVCPICGPKHDKEINDGQYPPAHPRCRCWVNHEIVI